MLSTNGHDFLPIPQQAECKVPVAVHAAGIVENHAVQNIEKLPAFGDPARQQGSDSGLNHNRDHAALQAVAGYISDTKYHTSVFRQDVVVIATHFGSRLHKSRDVQVSNPAQVL